MSGYAPTERSGGASGTAGASGSPGVGYQIVTGNVRVGSPVDDCRVESTNVWCRTPTPVRRSTTGGAVVVAVGTTVVGETVPATGAVEVGAVVWASPPPPHAVRRTAPSNKPPSARRTRPKLPRNARGKAAGHAARPGLGPPHPREQREQRHGRADADGEPADQHGPCVGTRRHRVE